MTTKDGKVSLTAEHMLVMNQVMLLTRRRGMTPTSLITTQVSQSPPIKTLLLSIL